jgi:hypothetical protein
MPCSSEKNRALKTLSQARLISGAHSLQWVKHLSVSRLEAKAGVQLREGSSSPSDNRISEFLNLSCSPGTAGDQSCSQESGAKPQTLGLSGTGPSLGSCANSNAIVLLLCLAMLDFSCEPEKQPLLAVPTALGPVTRARDNEVGEHALQTRLGETLVRP